MIQMLSRVMQLFKGPLLRDIYNLIRPVSRTVQRMYFIIHLLKGRM